MSNFFVIDPALPEDTRLLRAQEIARTLARFRDKVIHSGLPDGPKPNLGPCFYWTGAVKKPSRFRGPGSSSKAAAGGPELPYGQFKFQGRTVAAHRFAFAAYHKRDVETLGLISHECDNPLCVRPSHLKETVHTVNNREAYERGRKRVTVPRKATRADRVVATLGAKPAECAPQPPHPYEMFEIRIPRRYCWERQPALGRPCTLLEASACTR